MSYPIYPCLWFNNEAKQAAANEFGVSWQIVPTCLPRLMAEKGQRVVEAFLKMKKFDIKGLEEA